MACFPSRITVRESRGTARAYTLLAWDQFVGSDNGGRVPIERKLARVPAPRVFPREPKSLLQANITLDHRSQITSQITVSDVHLNNILAPVPDQSDRCS